MLGHDVGSSVRPASVRGRTLYGRSRIHYLYRPVVSSGPTSPFEGDLLLVTDRVRGDNIVCVVGLGYVGLTLSVGLALKGHRIIGVEKSELTRTSLLTGHCPFFESGLEEHVAALVGDGRLSVTDSIPDGSGASVYIITVGTPTDSAGRVLLTSIVEVAKALSSKLKTGDLVILRSTVTVGCTRQVVLPLLRDARVDFDLAFCPERTIEGRALEELSSLPQIVAGLTRRSRDRASSFFSRLAPTITLADSLEAAEIAKLVNNTERDVMFGLANEVALLCDSVGVPFSDVFRAATTRYSRSHLALPGLVGGPCLEKDAHILARSTRELEFDPTIIMAARKVNEELPRLSLTRLQEGLRIRGIVPRLIAILGVAFKGDPETSDIRGTMARPIIDTLKELFPGVPINGYDPLVSGADVSSLGVKPFDDLSKAVTGASLVIFQNNHAEFRGVNLLTLSRLMDNPSVIYDYWNMYDHPALSEGVTYSGLGNLSLLTRGSSA